MDIKIQQDCRPESKTICKPFREGSHILTYYRLGQIRGLTIWACRLDLNRVVAKIRSMLIYGGVASVGILSNQVHSI